MQDHSETAATEEHPRRLPRPRVLPTLFALAAIAVCVAAGNWQHQRLQAVQFGIGLTSVADAPYAATPAETAVHGAHPSEEMFREAGLAAARQSRPAEDRRGPVDYKLAMVREMTARALRLAAERAAMNV